MRISTSAATLQGVGYAKLKQQREAAAAANADHRREVESKAGKVLTSGRLGAIQTRKDMARAKIQAIRERITVLKKLFGANPRGMAKALANVFKELREAVKTFRDAGEQALAATGEGVRAVMAEGADEAEIADAGAEAEAEAEAKTKDGDAKGAGLPDQGPNSLYDEMTRAVREGIGRDGLQFIDDVRGLARELEKLLETARTQTKIHKRDQATEDAFEDADKALKGLSEDLDSMADDIKRAAPTVGMKLSVAA